MSLSLLTLDIINLINRTFVIYLEDILIYSHDLTLKESQVWAILGHLK